MRQGRMVWQAWQDPALGVDEGDVQREAHEEHVDRAAVLDAEPLPRREIPAPHQAAKPGQEGAGDRAALGHDGAVGGLQAVHRGDHGGMVAVRRPPCMVGG